MEIINLLNGYVGYPEIILVEENFTGKELFKVQLLAFHFDSILSNIPLGVYDKGSVMYNYFTAQGWLDEKWECTRIQEFYDQLVAINSIPTAHGLDDMVHALLQICQSALLNNNKLFIEYT